eukprot:TRINITY_DN2305_c0_g1_i4.p1 TRINITY_DN2305_c0_g1~~TRINITY_DN2305_c0_g1_i4.p1  ORF type:complete len:364 (-),score=47.00 TRINITY_DN2305_c0_g1_i4:397-1488(-)
MAWPREHNSKIKGYQTDLSRKIISDNRFTVQREFRREMGLFEMQRNGKGFTKGTHTSKMSAMALCIILFLLLFFGFICIQWSQFLWKARTDLRRESDIAQNILSFSPDFGILGVPWCRSRHGYSVNWTREDLLDGLKEFVPIYYMRPIKNNMFGMGFDHSFGLWFITRRLKPDLMIESGAFKGHSTWVLRQAMPDKPIISITPRHPEKYLKKGPAYVDSNCKYYSGKNFIDFGSIEWKSVMQEYSISDQSKVVVFFDNHQNELKSVISRLKQALKAGFRHLIFEDNYDTGTGDHYSLHQICDQPHIDGGGHDCNEGSDEATIREQRKHLWEKALDIKELCAPGGIWWGVRGTLCTRNFVSFGC